MFSGSIYYVTVVINIVKQFSFQAFTVKPVAHGEIKVK